MPLLVRSAESGNVTDCVEPCIVRSPVALYCTIVPTVGNVPSTTAWVRVNFAVGKVLTSMILPSNWAFRSLWSLFTLAMIHISEPTRQAEISYAVFCLKKKTKKQHKQ